jgi:hypothetical protein
MTSHRTSFNTYKVIDACNVYLGDCSIMEAIEMVFIIVKALIRGKIKIICIKDFLHVSNLQVNLPLVSIFLSNGLNV